MVVVLLVDTVILHPNERLQQDGFPGALLSGLPNEEFPHHMHDLGWHLCWVDGFIPFRVHFPMQSGTSCIRPDNTRYLH
jgi:hypothetical protein